MLFRAEVRTTAQYLLTSALTAQAATITTSKDTPVPVGKGSSVIIYTDDTKDSTGVGTPPQFRTKVLTTVEIIAEGKTKDEAEALCDTLCELTEIALLSSPLFVMFFEQIDSVDTRTDYRGVDSKVHTFSAVIEIKAHAGEIFEPTITAMLGGMNIYVDSVNVFDPAGTYDPPFDYPVAAEPRAAGPDGRIEISGSLDTTG